MLIVCSAGILVFGGGAIVLELLRIFFPKKVESFIVNTTRHLRRLVRLPSPNVVAPSVDTSNDITPFVDTSNDITPFVDTSNVVNVGEGLGKKSAVPLHLLAPAPCFFILDAVVMHAPSLFPSKAHFSSFGLAAV